MKTNTLRQRLAVYKKALKDYEDNVGITYAGFCKYFSLIKAIYCGFELEYTLPELARYKPKKDYPECYWCPSGETKPRIALLKKAIRYTESQIKKGKK